MGGVEAPARGQQCAGDKPYNGPTCCTTQRATNLLPSRVLGVQEGTWSTREKGGNEEKKQYTVRCSWKVALGWSEHCTRTRAVVNRVFIVHHSP